MPAEGDTKKGPHILTAWPERESRCFVADLATQELILNMPQTNGIARLIDVLEEACEWVMCKLARAIAVGRR